MRLQLRADVVERLVVARGEDEREGLLVALVLVGRERDSGAKSLSLGDGFQSRRSVALVGADREERLAHEVAGDAAGDVRLGSG